MIVTFHVAIYFIYYAWDTYISPYIEGIRNTSPGSGTTSGDKSNKPSSGGNSSQAHDVSANETPNDAQNSAPSNSEQPPEELEEELNNSPENAEHDVIPPESSQLKDYEEGNHPCLAIVSDEDKGSIVIHNEDPEYHCICSENKVVFIPPVYVQRYMEIEKVLKQQKWANMIRKVVDFGCAELSFEMKYLKPLHSIKEVVAVDIDTETLEGNCCKVSPFPSDFLNKRPTPLLIQVFRGSVAHTHDSLLGADAVIAIELIEHLFPPELDSLPFTVFGFIKPKIAIFTTPNSDFNVIFKGLTGFRHPDHKFEWSQQQFKDWGNNLVKRYPDYQVTFKGVGPGPPGSEEIGCCSQMATFVRVSESNCISDDEVHFQDGPYTLIAKNEFPFFEDNRTEEEKIIDAAENFLNNCKMRCRISEDPKSEIPMTAVMGRIKYHDIDKLKEMLMARSWEIKLNSSDEEVVVFPDSEEEEDSEPEASELITDKIGSFDYAYPEYVTETDENWDNIEGVDMDMTLNGSLNDWCNDGSMEKTGEDHPCMSDKSYHFVDTVNTPSFSDSTNNDKLVNSDKLNLSPSEKCSISETTVPEIKLCKKLSPSYVDSAPEKDSNLNFEKSIYETPYNNNFCNHLKSDCDLSDCSLPLSGETVSGCKRALVMESPKELTHLEGNAQIEDTVCCLSTVSSSCDTSIYATPCCSQRHRNNIPKCLSLQQISTFSGSPTFSTELDTTLKECDLVADQKPRFSKSMEGFKSLENDLTLSSTSKVVDSGYPDSYSECNMDMDLTPEQFDEIETEDEEKDASSQSMSPPPLPPQIPWLVDDVQNGDVVNNNRDGEGNNLVADMEEEPVEFEARIDEIQNEVLNLAPANDAFEIGHDMKFGEPFQEICGDHLPCISDTSSVSNLTNGDEHMSEKSPNHDLSKPKSVFTEKNLEIILSDSLDKQSLRSTKSDSSIVTNYSFTLDPSEGGHTVSKLEGASYCHKIQSPKLKTHNSLTTVLDGHSKFSNCSLVRPVEVYLVTGIEHNPPDAKAMPGGSRETDQQENILDTHATTSLTSTGLQDDHQSLVSVYQSAESLNVARAPPTEQDQEARSFPDWLLRINVSDIDENEVESVDSVQSVWDSDSLEDRSELNYDVQVDARAGGDPQRDTWH